MRALNSIARHPQDKRGGVCNPISPCTLRSMDALGIRPRDFGSIPESAGDCQQVLAGIRSDLRVRTVSTITVTLSQGSVVCVNAFPVVKKLNVYF